MPLIKLWMWTLRVRWRGVAQRSGRRLWVPRPAVFAVWHEDLALVTSIFPVSRVQALVSEHSDGEMIARIMARFNIETVRGSTTRGGIKAVLELLRQGEDLAIAVTPDGPRGPRRTVQMGVLYLASKTGAAIYPVGVYTKPRKELSTWDRMALPLPFGRALCYVDEPITVPPDLDRNGLREYRDRVEELLRKSRERVSESFEEEYASARPFGRLENAGAEGSG